MSPPADSRGSVRLRRVGSVALLLGLAALPVVGQELTPRAYWPTPKGIRLLTLAYSYTNGDILVDPALPVDAVDNETHGASLAYYHAFGLAGRSANLTVALPGAATRITAQAGSEEMSRSTSGFSDLQVRLGVNLLGAPAMTPQEFQEYQQQEMEGQALHFEKRRPDE